MLSIFSIFSKSAAEMKKLRTLTLAGFLAAIYAVSYSPFAGNFIIVRGLVEIRFGFIAIAVAGALFGPVVAAIVAVVGDIVGTLVFYGGDFFWGYTISWFLQGIMFGLFFYKEKIALPRVIGSMLCNTFIINLILTTKWESIMFHGVFTAMFIKRLPHNLIMLPINAVLLYFILRAVCKIRRRAYFTTL